MGIKETGIQGSIKRVRGDGLSLKLDSNEQILEIAGDGCTISMTRNCGSVRILGDGCRLRIDQNLGNVEYTGDGGRVLLGPKSIKENVKYVGDGGKVSFDGDSKTRSRNGSGRAPEKIDRAPRGTLNGAARDKSSISVEETENAWNEAKAGRRKEVVVKTKVVTKLCSEGLVSRWFANPGAVIKSLDGTFVKMMPEENKKVIVK